MAGRMPPPARGRPYYDANRGHLRIVPPGGGKAVPYVAGGKKPFDPGRTLRRSGLELGRQVVDDAASGATAVAGRQPFDLGAFGGFLIAAGASLAGLLFLDLVLRNAGAATGLIGVAGRGIAAFADPRDPLFSRTAAEPSTATSDLDREATRDSSTNATSRAGNAPTVKGLPKTPDQVPTPSGLLSVVDGKQIDRAFAPLTRLIESAYGVKLTSGYRDPVYNARVGGAPRSDHLTASAADFSGSPAAMARLARWAQNLFPYVEYDPLGIGNTADPTDHVDHVHISFWRKP